MSRPSTKPELLAAIDKEFETLFAVVDDVPSDRRASPGACDDWSVKDVLTHLDAWHGMFLGWNEAGSAGAKPAMPAKGYTWAETPELNAAIWTQVRNDGWDDGWDDVVTRLAHSRAAVVEAIDAYDADELFEKKRYLWTGSTSVGSYAVSATSSHYLWATKLVRKFARMR